MQETFHNGLNDLRRVYILQHFRTGLINNHCHIHINRKLVYLHVGRMNNKIIEIIPRVRMEVRNLRSNNHAIQER